MGGYKQKDKAEAHISGRKDFPRARVCSEDSDIPGDKEESTPVYI